MTNDPSATPSPATKGMKLTVAELLVKTMKFGSMRRDSRSASRTILLKGEDQSHYDLLSFKIFNHFSNHAITRDVMLLTNRDCLQFSRDDDIRKIYTY